MSLMHATLSNYIIFGDLNTLTYKLGELCNYGILNYIIFSTESFFN
jgi:hypothetical protein